MAEKSELEKKGWSAGYYSEEKRRGLSEGQSPDVVWGPNFWETLIELDRRSLHGKGLEEFERGIARGRETSREMASVRSGPTKSNSQESTRPQVHRHQTPKSRGVSNRKPIERPLGPKQYSPYDNSPDALRSRNGQVNSPVLGGTFGRGYYGGRDRMVPPGGRRIYDHDDPNAPYGATRWRNPNARGNYGGVWQRPEHR